MKRMVCEMCGGTDLMKDQGVFVCQSCGCKYSVEEAKKMMIEGVVQVEGTVQVDESNRVKNLVENADRLYTEGQYSKVIEACEEIFKIDVKNPYAQVLNYFAKENLEAQRCRWEGKESCFSWIRYDDKCGSALIEIKEDIADGSGFRAYCSKFITRYSWISRHFEAACKRAINHAHTDLEIQSCEDCLEANERSDIFMVQNILLCCDKGEEFPAEFRNKLLSLIPNTPRPDNAELASAVGNACKDRFWAALPEEKKKKEAELELAKSKNRSISAEFEPLFSKLMALENEAAQDVPAQSDLKLAEADVSKMNKELESLGLFKLKEKKALREKIAVREQDVKTFEKLARQQRNDYATAHNPEMYALKAKVSELGKQLDQSAETVRLLSEELGAV